MCVGHYMFSHCNSISCGKIYVKIVKGWYPRGYHPFFFAYLLITICAPPGGTA